MSYINLIELTVSLFHSNVIQSEAYWILDVEKDAITYRRIGEHKVKGSYFENVFYSVPRYVCIIIP